ncbi:ABC transporter ATP-binding protein [Lactobacillus iners]|jgi:ATP-binding cassette, subfamily B, multidrug efflux pump|uniref:ABC transporter ATP-binding protein n=1 Tax=Lactobacillus iners TaxID=147802 RepID=UPI0001FD79C8|nr:ABC transporter transmembrane domain-containing protein [Lactobacillus iners]EGC80359.1 ABC transporter, ATP-binding protein [Lactobacillus iners UPII 60-B]MCT7685494.1 ABC transporter transmembrane domain-containing protein [Lactobacillus iners]PNH17424.1 ABC transporter ATP-binding protein [Lactobacillus iners]QIH21305.1 ATP-binding cassette domain-containing protein [Lactobacillus iners]QIH22470.1 ATP-binding cassette domain-containing protein [Lactobacillus iners]
MGIYQKLGWFFKQHKKRYIFGIAMLMLTSLANLVPPRILGLMADQLNKKQITWFSYFKYTGLILVAALSLYVLRLLWRSLIWGGATILEKELRAKLFAHFMKMDRTFFQNNRTGDLMAHATNDVMAVQEVAGDGILTVVDAITLGGCTAIAMILFVDLRLTLIALLPMPLLAIFARYFGDKLYVAYDKSQAAFSKLNNKTQESVSGIKVLKTFGQAKQDTNSFNKMVDETICINKQVFKWQSMFDPLGSLLIGLTYVIAIIYGSILVNNQSITVGQLVSFVAYISNMVWPMFAIGYLFNILERGSASYDRIEKLLVQKPLITDKNADSLLNIQDLHSDLEFNIDSFAYPDDVDHNILKNIHFTLKPGQTLGLVGKVGAGKTTLIKLLLREYDNYAGNIKFGGENIQKIPLKELLEAISYVPQKNFLFSTTIAGNIAFSNPDATMDEIQAAAKKAGLHDDIMAMPEQYETIVGEKGVSLSGGQRQRMSIARALLKDSRVLILDDALSAVDAKTEGIILHNLKAEMHDKTALIASHKLSSVMDADLILVLKHGQIVEQGVHDELLKKKGWYAKMWERQELQSKVGENIDE